MSWLLVELIVVDVVNKIIHCQSSSGTNAYPETKKLLPRRRRPFCLLDEDLPPPCVSYICSRIEVLRVAIRFSLSNSRFLPVQMINWTNLIEHTKDETNRQGDDGCHCASGIKDHP